MKIAYVTDYDASDIRNWSGTGLNIGEALRAASLDLHYIGSLQDEHPLFFKIKRYGYRILGKNFLRDRSPLLLKDYARQIAEKLSPINFDVVFSPGTTPIAYLDCKEPIAFWTDATFASMINFYDSFSKLPSETIRDGHKQEQSVLDRCKLAIYSSEWAARSAIDFYKTDPRKVKVVPFGSNLKCDRKVQDIENIVASKEQSTCFLLFLGVDWIRKGGPMALQVAEDLNARGWKTELRIVGCSPPSSQKLPPFVKVFGFIPKSTEEGRRQLDSLLKSSHFLILPSVAECTPIAFCEANSYGLPCLATDIGGIPSVIRSGFNGRTFSLTATTKDYSNYLLSILSTPQEYRNLALSSFHEYESRLNWGVAGRTVKTLLEEVI